jgi:hypothetical protein
MSLYECELPLSARDELLTSRRSSGTPSPRRAHPHPRGEAPSGPTSGSREARRDPRRPFWLVLAFCFIGLVGSIYLSWRTAERYRVNQNHVPQAVAPTPTPQPRLPSPAPGPSADQMRQVGAAVPRAVLVRRVPRATLVKLPPQGESLDLAPLEIGRHYLLTMPYGLECRATYRGRLPSVDWLPVSGNHLGDMWMVGPTSTPWIWLWAPGAAHADWLDP